VIFRGKGTKLLVTEKHKWDKRVVDFKDNAWVDEKIMLRWLRDQWQLGQYMLRNTVPRMFVLDVHKAQKTEPVKDTMRRMNTLPAMVPSGCTSLVQLALTNL